MHVGAIMKRGIVTVRTDTSVTEAATLMREHHIGFLPVCDAGGRAVGVVTDRDITVRTFGSGRDPARACVADVMTPEVIACREEQPLIRAEALMQRRRVTRIVVLDDEARPIGVVSLSDVAQYERAPRVGRVLLDVTTRKYGPESGV
jgi:CBS domain-containing protein